MSAARVAKPSRTLLGGLASRVFGTANDRRLRRYAPIVERANARSAAMAAMTPAELYAVTGSIRGWLSQGQDPRGMLHEALAAAREAGHRALGLRAFDVQLTGALALQDGAIAQMLTGEGKTLAAAIGAYAMALRGEGVHVVTVNDYLARRDAAVAARMLSLLGMTVGVIASGMGDAERRAAYACDVTYGTNSEFGFDHLRDDMRTDPADVVQRGHRFAIVDEVDSILIDEARTPLVISGPSEDHSHAYAAYDAVAARLARGEHYAVDEKARSTSMTEAGNELADRLLREAGLIGGGDLYDAANSLAVHHLNQAVRARGMMARDRDYVVHGGEVVLIDQMTGRMTPGRRLTDGLHQAIEAKEGVAVQPESATLASITYQNYFRLYGTLSGMTGTAATEADEMHATYGLEVVEIPPNVPVARVDESDEVYRTRAEKEAAIAAEVKAANDRLQPVLIGTNSVEQSERIAAVLQAAGFTRRDPFDAAGAPALYAAARGGWPSRSFCVLNARAHDAEARIVMDAGVPGAVTIATNMAGRGTDIKLGGSAEARIEIARATIADPNDAEREVARIEAETAAFREMVLRSGESEALPGGLYVLGTERNESRRIDDQLRGRSGRQGDPGRSKFTLSLEDDLVRVFAGEGLEAVLDKLGLEPNQAISHPWVDKVISKAQAKVEQGNLEIRRNVLKFDDVANDQRKVTFAQRREIMAATDLSHYVADMRAETVADLVAVHIPEGAYPEQWDAAGLAAEVLSAFALDLPVAAWAAEEGIADQEVERRIAEAVEADQAAREARNTPALTRHVEKVLLLQHIDATWREHIAHLEHLRLSIGWRGLAQRDPVQEYRQEAFILYDELAAVLRRRVVADLSRVRVEMPGQGAEAA